MQLHFTSKWKIFFPFCPELAHYFMSLRMVAVMGGGRGGAEISE